jgi:periplasmic protein TonB
MRLPLTLSIAGHAVLLGLLILVATDARLPEPTTKGGTQIFLGPSFSQAQTVLTPEAASQPAAPSAIATLPPQEVAEPEPAVATVEPPSVSPPEIPASPLLQTEPVPPSETAQIAPAPPPPPRKPVTRQPAKPVMRSPPRGPVSEPAALPTQLATLPDAVGESRNPTVQQAAAAPVPAPDFAAEYRAMISAWFEAHKYYPDPARQRGEEGTVRLSFRVDRFGRVLDHTLLTGTGYADLDAGVDQMMHGAQLPPFPAGMTMSQIEVAVTIRFSLTR